MFIPIWLVVLGAFAMALWVIVIVSEVIMRLCDEEDYSEFDLSLPNNPRQSREIYELERENFWYRKHIEKTNADYMKTLDELNDASNYIDHLKEKLEVMSETLVINTEHSMMFNQFLTDTNRYDIGVLKEELDQAIKENNELKIRLNKFDDLHQHTSHRLDCAVAQNSELEIKLKARDKMISDNLSEIRRLESNKGKNCHELDTLINTASDIYLRYDNSGNSRELNVEFGFTDLPMSQWDRVFEIMNKIKKLRGGIK